MFFEKEHYLADTDGRYPLGQSVSGCQHFILLTEATYENPQLFRGIRNQRGNFPAVFAEESY